VWGVGCNKFLGEKTVTTHFEVIGQDGSVQYVSAEDVMGAVLGGPGKKSTIQVQRAEWREHQLAPGVQAPDQGMVPLGLAPSNGTGVFALGVTQLDYVGKLQKPFRGERIMARVVRVGASATGTLLAQIFVGTDLQQGSIRGVNIENIGDVNGFGVRMTMSPAQPGVEFTFVVRPTVALAGADTISLDIEVMGRIVM
jgi:hypothetical protein